MITLICSKCKQRKSLFIWDVFPPVCYTCWKRDSVVPPSTIEKHVPDGELWVVLTVENQHYGDALNTYPSWRAAWVASQRQLGWRHITRIYPKEKKEGL